MASINKVILICSLGKDPEVRQTQNGTAICNLSAATSRKYKDTQGGMQEETEWHLCIFCTYDILSCRN